MVNVCEVVIISEKMANSIHNPILSGFHAKISSQVKMMEHLKRGMKIDDKIVFDL